MTNTSIGRPPRPPHRAYVVQMHIIRRVLLAAGPDGLAQRHLFDKTRSRRYPTVDDMLKILLNEFYPRRWVQRFDIPAGSSERTKRPYVLWRATKRLETEWAYTFGEYMN